MLGKLLKYEIPAMGRKMLPLYAAWAAAAFILGLSTQSADSKSEFIVVISALLYTAIATAIMVMTVIMIVQRYSNSLLGDEAYFNHVLPVTASAHIANKLISATLWVFVTILVAALTAILIGLGGLIVAGLHGMNIGSILHDLFNIDFNFPKHFGLYVIEVLILVLASAVKTIMQIYAAVTIGRQVPNHTTLASIGAYIVIMMFESTVGRMMVPVFLRGWMQIDLSEAASLQQVFIPALIGTVLFSALYFFICKYLMEKRLNLA